MKKILLSLQLVVCFSFIAKHSYSQCNGLTVSLSVTDTIVCAGNCTGAITVTVTNGDGNYHYIWSANANGATTQNLTSLCGDNGNFYSVTAVDGLGCSGVGQATITTPSPVQLNLIAQGISCSGKSDGYIKVYPSGGWGGYIFTWSDGSHSDSISGLGVGTYCVTIADKKGCSNDTCITFDDPESMVVTVFGIASCGNSCDGAITEIDLSGGNPGYHYNWGVLNDTSFHNHSSDPIRLCPGIYTVTVTDANGCSATGSVDISQLPGDSLTLTVGQNYIDANIYGSSPPFMFYWNNGATTQNIINLTSGLYSVTVSDSNGCGAIDSATIYPLSVKPISETFNSFTIMPNPNDGVFQLGIGNIREGNRVEIFNILGEKVFMQVLKEGEKNLNISLDDLSEGIYITNLYFESGVETKKFIISK